VTTLIQNASIVLFSLILFSFATVSSAPFAFSQEEPIPEEPEINFPGMVSGTGTHFEITDSQYLNVTLDSTEPINLVLESFPEMIIMIVVPNTTATSTDITFGGFSPNTTYHQYEDDYHNHLPFTTDSNGSYTFTQDLSSRHLVMIQPNESTFFISNDATGGDCAGGIGPIGTWNAATKTCTIVPIPHGITMTIQIDDDGITLDGDGNLLLGPSSGVGVFVSGKNDVTIKNLRIERWSLGIFISGGSGNTITNNSIRLALFSSSDAIVNENVITTNFGRGLDVRAGIRHQIEGNIFDFNDRGVLLGSVRDSSIVDNSISNNSREGLRLSSSNSNIIKENRINDNFFFGISLSSSFRNLIDGNEISSHRLGIVISRGSLNTVIDNTIQRNNDGIEISFSSGNQIFNNNFISNLSQANQQSGSNTWNLASPIGGNYWSDFDEPGEGCNNIAPADSFCDVPRPVPIGNPDNFPWTVQNGWLNLPPIADANGPYSGDEGTAIPIDGTGSNDPDGDPLTFAWSTTGGTISNPSDATTDVTYADNGAFTVELEVTDTGGLSDTDSAPVTVNNVAPSIEIPDPPSGGISIDEGDTFGTGGVFSDPGVNDAPWIGTVNYDEGAGVESLTLNPDKSFTLSNTYDDNGSFTVAVGVTDKDGDIDTANIGVLVNNVAPTCGAITAPLVPVQVDTEINPSSSFTDPGILDTHVAKWVWSDSTVSAGTVNEVDGSGTVTGSHTYTEAGIHTLTLSVADKDGDSCQQIFEFVVVYDPTGGFVTGGGWINSPAGAYLADDTLTGKANFGFVSKYKKGTTTPTGETEFQFKTGNLNFHSDSYDWLVIAGHKAMYKGVGTINGAGNFGFMLSAIDEKLTPSTDTDLFRIKIWDKDNADAPVYDNQVGEADDNAYPTTEISGGQIVIHKAK